MFRYSGHGNIILYITDGEDAELLRASAQQSRVNFNHVVDRPTIVLKYIRSTRLNVIILFTLVTPNVTMPCAMPPVSHPTRILIITRAFPNSFIRHYTRVRSVSINNMKCGAVGKAYVRWATTPEIKIRVCCCNIQRNRLFFPIPEHHVPERNRM